jgi:pyruvate,water dikinase
VTATAALADLRAADEPRFGGKSAALGELLGGGLPVPGGFAVAVDAYRTFVREAGLGPPIAAALHGLDADDVEAVRGAAGAIAEAIASAPMPADVGAAIVAGYTSLEHAPGAPALAVAVRSSALGEDSAAATFAGQQETRLWIRGADAVADAVRACWVSLYSPEAISYRARLPDGGAEAAMGVTVQLMVDAAVSGVLFTCNPVSGDPSVVAIDASWGLGLSVVGGEVTPDEYLVSKITGDPVRRTIGDKRLEYVPDPDGDGPVAIAVDASRAGAPCLDDDRLRALVDLARRVQAHFGSHQDVEWAIDRDGDLFVLQARPVTAREKPQGPAGVSAMSLIMSTFGAGDRPR